MKEIVDENFLDTTAIVTRDLDGNQLQHSG